MATFYHVTKPRKREKPGNRKVNRVGARHIFVTTTGKQTCPTTCPLYEYDCYAEKPPLVYHWLKVTDGQRGTIFPRFIEELRSLPPGSIIRLNQAGDLPGDGAYISDIQLTELVRTCQEMNHQVCTYTHKPVLQRQWAKGNGSGTNPVARNREKVLWSNQAGFAINVSCSDFTEVEQAVKWGFTAITVTLPKNFHDKTVKKLATPEGTDVVICPGDRFKGERGGDEKLVTCTDCMLCWKYDRRYAVGFMYKDRSNIEAHKIARERKVVA